MSTPLDLDAEEFSATGSLASEGVRNQLGRPSLDRMSVLVREAAQNSWDAKARSSQSVTFGFAAWDLTAPQIAAIEGRILATVPPESTTPKDGRALARYVSDLRRGGVTRPRALRPRNQRPRWSNAS